MLILRRRVGEVLLIGEDVAIEVLECGSWGVKLGIRAPQGVLILRKELRMTGEANAAAANGASLAELERSARNFSTLNSRKGAPPR